MIIDQLRVIGSPQTNRAMQAEITRIVGRRLARRLDEPKREGTGQLVWAFNSDVADLLCAYARTPTRIVRDLYRVRAMRLEPLFDALVEDMRADTRLWAPGKRLSVEVRRMEAFGAGERQIVGVVKNALQDAYQGGGQFTVDPDRPDVAVVARLDDAGDVVISLDLAGGSLSARGWRRDQGEAPLREHLAAVLVMLSRFDARKDTLVDPFCGSGTIAIEAALMAKGIGRDGALPLFADADPVIIGSDIDMGILGAARANARRAGADVEWMHGDVRRLTPKIIERTVAARAKTLEGGVILCNPPYGQRLIDLDLADLYADMFSVFAGFPGWRVGLLGPPELGDIAQGRLVQRKPLANGNLRTYFFLYEM